MKFNYDTHVSTISHILGREPTYVLPKLRQHRVIEGIIIIS